MVCLKTSKRERRKEKKHKILHCKKKRGDSSNNIWCVKEYIIKNYFVKYKVCYPANIVCGIFSFPSFSSLHSFNGELTMASVIRQHICHSSCSQIELSFNSSMCLSAFSFFKIWCKADFGGASQKRGSNKLQVRVFYMVGCKPSLTLHTFAALQCLNIQACQAQCWAQRPRHSVQPP